MLHFGCRKQTQTVIHRHFSWCCTEPKMCQPLTLLCQRGAGGHGERGEGRGQSRDPKCDELSNKSGECRGAASAGGPLDIAQQMVTYSRFSLLLPLSYPTALTSGFSHFYLIVILPHRTRSNERSSGTAELPVRTRSSAGPEGFAAAFLSRERNRRKRFPVPKGCAGSGMLCARPPHPSRSVPAARNAASS